MAFIRRRFPKWKTVLRVTGGTLEKRVRAHRHNIRKPRYPFHKALKRYNAEVEFQTLVIGERDYIHDLEIKAIKAFQTRNIAFGYNVTVGGDRSPMSTPEVAARCGLKHRGKVVSKEAIAKMLKSREGYAHSEETKARIGSSQQGKIISREAVAKMLVSRKGYRHGPEALAKMSAAMKGNKHAVGQVWSDERRKRHGLIWLGRSHSIDSREKVAASKRGKKRSPEICAMLSRVHKGKTISAAQRAKISQATKGKPKSEETKARMREAWRQRRLANGSVANPGGEHTDLFDRADWRQ